MHGGAQHDLPTHSQRRTQKAMGQQSVFTAALVACACVRVRGGAAARIAACPDAAADYVCLYQPWDGIFRVADADLHSARWAVAL